MSATHDFAPRRRDLLFASLAGAFLPGAALAAPSPAIRICGSTQMRGLIDTWIRAYARLHPSARFEVDLRGTATAQFGLHMNTADIALSVREIYPYEYYGIYRRSQLLTVEIPVAIGSPFRPGHATAMAIFVHRDNPLSKLSVTQLDRIFGAERAGGWQRMEWATDVARAADSNIRTWGQLGLSGEWANKPIIPYGLPAAHPGGVSYFQNQVMGGADTWNERLREYPDGAGIVHALAMDRYGIGYATLGDATPGVKAIALAEHDGGPYVPLTAATVAANSYPLTRFAYMYLAPDTVNGDPARFAPHVQAFLAFVLSSTGQAATKSTYYSPLPSATAAKLSSMIAVNALAKPLGSEAE